MLNSYETVYLLLMSVRGGDSGLEFGVLSIFLLSSCITLVSIAMAQMMGKCGKCGSDSLMLGSSETGAALLITSVGTTFRRDEAFLGYDWLIS